MGPGLLVLPASAPSAGHSPSPCGAWEGTAPTWTCREWGSAQRGAQRRGKRAPVNPTQFSIRPEQLSLEEIRLYQVSSSELHPRIGFERLLVPAAHLLLQPPQQLPLESTQPCRALEEMQTQRGAAGSWHLVKGWDCWHRGRQSPQGWAWSSATSQSLWSACRVTQ